MLRQEIQQTQETLAARDAELGDLKARVAELEKIREQQQQLIAMKDSALATARENLAKASTAQQEPAQAAADGPALWRSEEHTSELQSLMRISYAVFCLKKKKTNETTKTND